MYKVEIKTDKLTIEVPEQFPLIDMCEDYDTSILFGCRDGACGACMIRVIEHPENLSKMKEDERDFLETMAARPDERLACQCRVLGDVVIDIAD